MSAITEQLITAKDAAKPVAPYNQAVVADRAVYVSGCLGLCKETNTVVTGGAAAEMPQALRNVGAILDAANSGFDRVIKTTIYVEDLADFASINAEYKKVFQKDYPARSCVQLARLPANGKVEIEVIAISGNGETVRHPTK